MLIELEQKDNKVYKLFPATGQAEKRSIYQIVTLNHIFLISPKNRLSIKTRIIL